MWHEIPQRFIDDPKRYGNVPKTAGFLFTPYFSKWWLQQQPNSPGMQCVDDKMYIEITDPVMMMSFRAL